MKLSSRKSPAPWSPRHRFADDWHRPGFNIDEDALPVGMQIMSLTALALRQ